MTGTQWLLILTLAIGSYGLRLTGYLAGARIRSNPRVARMLDDLPGILVISLVAAAMSGEGPDGWIAAAIALGLAVATGNVVATMIGGVAAYTALSALGGF